MLGPWIAGPGRLRQAVVLVAVLALLLLLLLLPGAAAAQDRADLPPEVTNVAVSPMSLPHTGGEVTISADVTDDIGVVEVRADLGGYDQSLNVPLSWTGVGDHYSATFTVPGNGYDFPVYYNVTVSAQGSGPDVTTAEGGQIEVEAQPQFDQAPYVFDPSVAPRALGSGGGPVALAVSATDDRSVSEVFARVTTPGGAMVDVPLEPVSSSRFEGVYSAPANTTTTAARYSVEMIGHDDIGQPGTADGGAFTVAARSAPPASGTLRVVHTSRDFGAAWVGASKRRTIVVRNVGGRSTAPVAGTLVASGAPFSVVGAGSGGLPFCLRAGETRTFEVEFRPTRAGVFTGTARVRRDDGAQPGLGVALRGEGKARRKAGPAPAGGRPKKPTCR